MIRRTGCDEESMPKRDQGKGKQKGAQDHAEGQQGKKTRARQQEILHSGQRHEDDPRIDATGRDVTHGGDLTRGTPDGDHRLFENRQQHDEAEKNSEKNRLSRDINRHDHDRRDFPDVPGGTASEPYTAES
jgi:hypothetical protein